MPELHYSAFEYLKPTDDQIEAMATIRSEAARFNSMIETYVPDGPDRTYAVRKLRELTMWLNTAITREADGSPRNVD